MGGGGGPGQNSCPCRPSFIVRKGETTEADPVLPPLISTWRAKLPNRIPPRPPYIVRRGNAQNGIPRKFLNIARLIRLTGDQLFSDSPAQEGQNGPKRTPYRPSFIFRGVERPKRTTSRPAYIVRAENAQIGISQKFLNIARRVELTGDRHSPYSPAREGQNGPGPLPVPPSYIVRTGQNDPIGPRPPIISLGRTKTAKTDPVSVRLFD